MDYSYLHPRCVQDLYDEVILESVAECRLALHLLGRRRCAAAQEFRAQLSAVVATLEGELVRRGGE